MGLEEERAYEFEQMMLPFDKKDCFFCRGAKCDACSRTGKLSALTTEERWNKRSQKVRILPGD
jgi:hypothetical protein